MLLRIYAIIIWNIYACKMCFSYEEWLGMHKRCKVRNILLWPSSITLVLTIAATICGRLRTMVACRRQRTHSALLALCEANPPVTGGFPSQIASNMEFDITFACVRHRTYDMMIWHGGIMTWERSHITGSLWGESTSHWWIPLTNSQ